MAMQGAQRSRGLSPAMLLLALNLLVTLVTTTSAPYDLTHFEKELWPNWVGLFLTNDSRTGAYSWLPRSMRKPGQDGPSLYGTTDMVYASFAVGTLQQLSLNQRAEWAAIINSFQNRSTGWYEPYEWEDQNKANWPWHPTGAALEALDLLDCPTCIPRYPMSAESALLDNAAGWGPFMDINIATSKNIWGGSQQAQGLFALMRSARPADAVGRYGNFTQWYFDYLNNHSSRISGYWAGDTADLTDQLGGAFHIYKAYSCSGEKWPHPDKVVDTTLSLQNKSTGMWRTGDGGQNPGLSFCLDLDGIYSLTRSAQLAQGVVTTRRQEPYRWDDVKQACSRYVKTAHAQLSDPANVLGGWAKNSHLMHGALFAVAECGLWFPDLTKTIRPWQRARMHLNNRSCMYA